MRSFQRIALLGYKRLSVVGVHQRHAERVETIPTGNRKALRCDSALLDAVRRALEAG
jgi:hypothetical protein